MKNVAALRTRIAMVTRSRRAAHHSFVFACRLKPIRETIRTAFVIRAKKLVARGANIDFCSTVRREACGQQLQKIAKRGSTR